MTQEIQLADRMDQYTRDLPPGIDLVMATKRTRVKIEIATVLISLQLKVPLRDARGLAWRSAIERGDATAVKGLKELAESDG